MKKYLLTPIITCLIVSFSLQQIFAQKVEGEIGGGTVTILGSTTAYQNDTKTYTATPSSGLTIYNAFWSATGGIIQSQTTTSVTIKWNTTGIYQLDYEATHTNMGYVNANLSVTVSESAVPPTPNTPSINSQDCSSANLWASGSPPSGVTWYWQGTNSVGTNDNSSNNAIYPFVATTSGVYYLRAKNISSGAWSSTSASITVSLGTIGGTIWYQDLDGDGLGDPDLNNSIVSCSKPNGYVANNNDQCVGQNGGGTPNGCPFTGSLSNDNYIYTIFPQIESTNTSSLIQDSHAIRNVTYFDGLGRPKQSIAIKQSVTSKDIVTHYEYNNLGQQIKEYLPYPSSTSGGYFKTDALTSINTYYKTNFPEDINISNPNPYSEKDFDDSPLNRIIKQSYPGYDWRLGSGHEVKFDYDTNTNSEVRLYTVSLDSNGNPTLVLNTNINNGYYEEGKLIKNITFNENHNGNTKDNSVEEYKNKQGKIVLKRLYENNIAHDTYYVYDDFGNLTFVIPPKANETTIDNNVLNQLCYQYKYDSKKKIVEKKIPGKGWEYIIYDELGRIVATQDKNQREINQWTFTKYDELGQIAYTGLYTNSSNRETMQSGVYAYANYETRTTTPTTMQDGSLVHYTKNAFPNSGNQTILTVKYYDNYNFDLAGSVIPTSIPSVYGTTVTNNAKGLITGTKTKVLGTNDWITTITYYDDKARPIYVYSYNAYLKTTDIELKKLDFVGKVIETTNLHTNTNSNLPTLSLYNKFDYDHTGRVKKQTQWGTNISGTEVIFERSYNELGKLLTKKVGGKTTQSRLQEVNYKFNIRGWLKSINQDAKNDLFSFDLNYNTLTPSSGTALYNGNISQINWNSLSLDTSTKTYTFYYDALNRIKSAIDNTGEYNLGSLVNPITYDKNGNILTLKRRGAIVPNPTKGTSSHFGLMDDLTYTYDNENKLLKVIDNGNSIFGFNDGVNTSTEYTYDSNGNMITDSNKGITNITYNHLNLPTSVTFNPPAGLYGGTRKISYIYDANGTKLEKKVTNIIITGAGPTGSTNSTYYAGNFVYKKIVDEQPILGGGQTTLQFFNQPEGYVKNNNGVFSYVYQFKDQVGNIRLSYSDSDQDGMISEAIFADSFESSSGWSSQGSLYGSSIDGYDTSKKHSGIYSGKIVKSTSGEKYVHSNTWIPINNGQATNYTFSGWVYTDNPSVDLFLFMKKDGETSYFTNVESVRNYTKNQWVYIEKTVSVPSNIRTLNIRIDNNGGGTVWFDDIRIRKEGTEIIEESNYYPFGLKHKGYNNVVSSNGNSTAQKRGFQDQMLDDELGLNWNTFKYRNYDPSLARFHNIDPLAEDYNYQSPYNFSENRLIDGVELEGLEWESIKKFFRQVHSGWDKLIGEPMRYSRRKEAERIAVYGTPNRKPIGRNITGNYFGDALFRLMGGDTYRRAYSGNQRARGQLLMNAPLLFLPSGRTAVTSRSANSSLFNRSIFQKGASSSLPDGSFYSVAFRTKLSPKSYPGVSRYMHFKESNYLLNNAILADKSFAKSMSQLGVEIPLLPSGSFNGISPRGWVWHHNIETGIMELVPKSQHPNVPGGIFWETMHPNRIGGYSIWGKSPK
ncbi:MAG: HNH endonuclease [Flavobacteriaceae bacterium]|nr:HNH endonuclease [Flavobacteriaceae bacterium]